MSTSKLIALLLILIIAGIGPQALATQPVKPAKSTKLSRTAKPPAKLKPLTGAEMDTFVAPTMPSKSYPKSTMLEGSLEHSETLSAEDSRFAAGAKFDAEALPKPTAGNNWHWIPPWFAGTYKTDTISGVYRFDFGTGETNVTRRTSVNRRQEKWGWQKDRLGGIWQYDGAPYKIVVDLGEREEVQIVKSREPVRLTNDSAILRFRSTSVVVNKATNQIEWSYQSEYLQTYRPISNTRVELRVSAKIFDLDGRPMTLDKNIQYLDRIRGFEFENEYKGKDMRQLFREFLLATGRPDLVPDSIPSIPDNQAGF